MRRTALTLLLVLTTVSLLPAQTTSKSDDLAAARAGIAETNNRAVAAAKVKDFQAAAALYTDDAILFPPGQEAVSGHDAIVAFFKKMHSGDGVLLEQDFTPIGLELIADGLALETTYFHGTVREPGKPDSKYRGKSMILYKRQADGTWKMYRDMWDIMI